ncbi:transcription factor iiia-like protein [Podospora australis]|uniref:Transcription factor iiia-like protein n=1 Tax=Podospora australis TaxID=1536484 RepID=A0AAN7AJJ0_9PEZI|nr:transcription factor iiia-like protein [Podospora australis]
MSARATRAMKRKASNEEELLGPTKRQQLDPTELDNHSHYELGNDDEYAPVDDTAESTSVYNEDDASDSTARPNDTSPNDGHTVAATSIEPSMKSAGLTRKFPSDLKTIPCTYPGCPKTFNRPARLTAHLRSHTNDRAHRCPYPGCDKDYLEEKHLKQHIKGSHTHEKKYVCEEEGCDKSFVTATRLRRHALVHQGAERFRCRGYEGCSLSFRKRETLQRHIRTEHLNQPAFICGRDGCQEGFDTAGALRRHTEREHGELRFWCDECVSQGDDGPGRVGFRTLQLLQTHVRKEHLECMFCGVKCGRQSDLEKHMDIYHSGNTVQDRKTIACHWEGCDKKFTRQSNLNTHIRSAHEGKRFVCGEVDTFDTPDITDWNWREEGCGQSFVSRMKLEEHVRFIHLGRKRPPKLYSVPSKQPGEVDEMTGSVSTRTLACTVEGCTAKFVRHADLNRHIDNGHHNFGYEIAHDGQDYTENGHVDNGYGNQELEHVDNGYGNQQPAIDPQLQEMDAPSNAMGGDQHFWLPADPVIAREGMDAGEWAELQKLIDYDREDPLVAE